MKLFIILLIVNAHVHAASIFGEFRDVMSSLENSFQRMITDVVTDVRDTIDCTVEAVENALSLGSTLANPKCREAVKAYKNGNTKNMPLPILSETSFSEVQNNGNYGKVISKPNKYENQDMQNIFVNDDRLENIRSFLRDEFEKMSANMRLQFKEIESNEKSALDVVIKYINILHNLKNNSKSDSEVNEAKRILDGASKILNVNVKNDNSDANVNKLLTTLQESNQGNDKQSTLSQIVDNNFTNERHNASHLSTGTLKDIVNKALGTTQDNKGEEDKKINEVKNHPLSHIDVAHNIEDNVESMDYESLFGSSHSESNNDAVDDATKILEDSKRTNSILSNFFAQAAESGSSIFDNSDPF